MKTKPPYKTKTAASDLFRAGKILTRAYLKPKVWRRLKMEALRQNLSIPDMTAKLLNKHLPQYVGRKPSGGK